MNKKIKRLIAYMIVMCLSIISLSGCIKLKTDKDESKDKPEVTEEKKHTSDETYECMNWSGEKSNNGFIVGERYNPSEIVKKAVRPDDKFIDFKIEQTDKYLVKMYTLMDELDSKFEYGDEPEVLVPVKTQYQYNINLTQSPIGKKTDYTKFNKDNIIEEIDCSLVFEDGEQQVAVQQYRIELMDGNKSGAIKLTDQAKKILKAVYPKIDLEQLQKCIDSQYAAGLAGTYETEDYDSKDKYTNVYLSKFFSDEYGQRKVSIRIQTHVDYPVE